MNGLPIKRDLTLAYTASLVVAALIVFVSAAGLLWDKGGLYGAEPTLVQVSPGGDVANLVVGLPAEGLRSSLCCMATGRRA